MTNPTNHPQPDQAERELKNKEVSDIFHQLFLEAEGELWETYYDTSDGEPYRKAEEKIMQLLAQARREGEVAGRIDARTAKDIKKMRQDLRLTQQDMAVFMGVSRMTLYTWEETPHHMPFGKYHTLAFEYERLAQLQSAHEGKNDGRD